MLIDHDNGYFGLISLLSKCRLFTEVWETVIASNFWKLCYIDSYIYKIE